MDKNYYKEDSCPIVFYFNVYLINMDDGYVGMLFKFACIFEYKLL